MLSAGATRTSQTISVLLDLQAIDSTAALRYFTHPPPNANLREGLETFMRLPFKDRVFKLASRLDNVFRTCLDSANSEELLKAEVVTWRGIMRRYPFGVYL